ncbi:unnamed protein product [Rotaria sp. Silwood1]|nr:unnamed protein product [Rotaria sp. Silwood1]CAF4910915.1 unnamed protein product [Rotaria sp. Silwood1]
MGAFVDDIQFVLIDLSTAMNLTVTSILHFLQIFLPSETISVIDNLSIDKIIQLIKKPACLFTRNNDVFQLLIQRLGSNNLLIYTIEDDTKLVDGITRYSNVDDLVDKLVELVVKKYQQQAETHMHEGQRQLADIEIRMANRIEYEVQKLRES